MKSEYKINGQTIKRPDDFSISRFNVTDLQRNAAALMVGDLIAKKRKFFFTYTAIRSDDFDHILSLIWDSPAIFMDLTYVENNVVKTAKVYVGEIPSLFHRSGALWVWKNVTFNLIEQ